MKKYILVVAVICSSCNTTKKLSKLYDKELTGRFAHLCRTNKIVINKDSTFVYQGGCSIVEYTKGFWRLSSDKKGIILTSILLPDNNKPNQPIDTIYLKFDSLLVKIKSKTTVEMKKELFNVSQ